jgi:DNA-binding GntR family transcriptional regulator
MSGALGKMQELEYESLTDQAYARIREAILNNEFRPGERLAVGQVSEQLGVSRTPVREAFQRLQVEGLLDIKRGIGAYVTKMSRQDLEEVYEVSAVLMALAARRAAQRLSHHSLHLLRELVLEVEAEERHGDARSIAAASNRFHQLIIDESGMPMLKAMLADTYARIERFHRAIATVPSRRQTVAGEHRRIVELLERRDGESAFKLMESHIRGALAAVLTWLDDVETGT